MTFQAGHTYHTYNQGNNREKIFFEEENYIYFIQRMRKQLLTHCDILAWCLMPNHFRWLVRVKDDYKFDHTTDNPKSVGLINKRIANILSSYTQAINKKYNRSGSLFRPRTKSKSIGHYYSGLNDYGLNCMLYIHQNPLRGKIVDHLHRWEYSSYRDYAGLRKGTLCNIELAKELFNLPNSTKEFEQLSLKTIPFEFTHKLESSIRRV